MRKFGPSPTQPNKTNNLTVWCNQILSNRALNALTKSFQILSNFAIVDRTQSNPLKTEKSRPHPTQHNPTYGATQPELSMGPFCMNQSNPTHQLTDPAQPTTSEKIGPNPTPLSTNCHWLTLSLYYSF